MTNWKLCTVGDLCSSISETYSRTDAKVVLVNTSDVLNGKILNHQSINNENLKGQFKKTFKRDDILYSEIRPANKRFAYVDFDETANYIASTKLMVLRTNPNLVNPRFLFYFLTSYNVLTELQHLAETRSGTFPQITFSSELAPIPILLPDSNTQVKIINILKTIDDKIELNIKINENLEQQAQSIYTNMFPNVLDPEAKETLSELITFSNGKKRPNSIGPVPVYGGNGILAYTADSNANNCVVIGRVGAYCGNTFLCMGNCWVSDNAIQAKSKYSDSPLFIYYLLKNASLQSRHIGTGQPLMTQGILNSIPVSIPEKDKINRFLFTCKPIVDKMSSNVIESATLASIKDVLLPKLMSGELDVSNINT